MNLHSKRFEPLDELLHAFLFPYPIVLQHVAANAGQQLTTLGLGKVFSSPVKHGEKWKTTTYVVPLGQDIKRRRLEEKLCALESGLCLAKSEGSGVDKAKSEESSVEAEIHEEISNDLDELPGPDLPLQQPFLNLLPPCSQHVGEDTFRVSVHLLNFYQALFERSCDAVNMMATALNTFYTCWGFILLNNKRQPIRDPFQCGLGHAIHGGISTTICRHLDSRIQDPTPSRECNPPKSFESIPQTPHLLTGVCYQFLESQITCSASTSQGNVHAYFSSDVWLVLWVCYMDDPPKCCGSNSKMNMEKFDDGGQMALVCRHDIPLFFANIDTPGEQQNLLPPEASTQVLYDVGCLLDRTLQLDLVSWMERVWSHLCKLIGITHASAIWLIDRQATSIGLELCDNLGDWIRHRLTKGIGGHTTKAKITLNECDAPSQLKKELDVILNLPNDLDTVDNAIHATHSLISKSAPSNQSLQLLEALEETQDHLKTKVEALYASLNIHESFPELQGLDLKFVQTLIMACNLKINLHKRAIRSFFEWDRLDQAVGGHDQVIGTKIHQSTRKAISKCKLALMNAICKFNKYCEALKNLYKPEWNIPLPELLLTQLAVLRDSSSLMEDVWIAPAEGEVPRWLEDHDVREGIRAILKLDQCLEEQCHLGIEADNLCRWFGQELSALEVMLSTPSNGPLIMLLQQKCTHLLNLKSRWTNVLASSSRFDVHLKSAQTIRSALSPCERSHIDVPAEPMAQIETDPELDLDDDLDLTIPEFGVVESETVILNDILVDSDTDEADEMDVVAGEVDISLIWAIPVHFDLSITWF
ncbi:hypothetical protein L208DRAFT_1383114 [Tricholoma matsutake]|nr:hypothetical protein L208DRAFT_1383114 [Tricholoma matsutake 945]